MNREILFRGKTISFPETMISGSLVDRDNRRFILLQHLRSNPITKNCYEASKFNMCLNYLAIEVIPETVGQYTGYTDEIGNKIFEGDWIRDSSNQIGEVFYSEDTAKYQVNWKLKNGTYKIDSHIERGILCGNIYGKRMENNG